jgi:nitroimidazol reductase NimA-like FMN-containing flavoprotein (pyridoxamine 5'-phosphate oxidase superfamily)
MASNQQLVITELDRSSALDLLSRKAVGRIAYTFHDRVDIEPISYVYDDGWIYARTSPGSKLTTVSHHPYVALEVDEIDDPFHWRSVVARGTIYFPRDGHGERETAEYRRAVELLRQRDPSAFSKEDAVPHRRVVFRIHIDEITGREAGHQ